MSKQKVELDGWQVCVFFLLLAAIMIWLINIEQEACRIRKALEAPQSVQSGLEDPDANNAALEGWRVTMVREANE